MKRNLTMQIKRRTQSEWLIWLIVVMPLLCGAMIDFLGVPGSLKYSLDIVWGLLALYLLLSVREKHSQTYGVKQISIWATVFFLYTLLAYIPQYQSVLYYAWGIRNNFRYYIAFFAFVAFLKTEDIGYYFSLFDKLFWVNAVITVVQYFAFGVYGDHLGGIFGYATGCNGYTNLFFVIISAKTLIGYLNKTESLKKCFVKCVTMLAIAAIAELKFFYIEFWIIIVMLVLSADFSWRKLYIIIFGTLGVILGAYGLMILFPNFAGFLSVEGILEIAASKKGYTSSGDLNRLTAIPIISRRFLKTGAQQFFGLGLGNCDTSSFEFLNTPFFRKNGWLHYSWMSYAEMYLECGWIGLVFYFGFFVLVYFGANRVRKTSTGMKNTYCRIAMIMAVICMAISIYNNSLRTESGYMAYFVLALPFTKNVEPPTPRERSALN